MSTQRRIHGERIHRGEIIGYLPSARRAEFKTDDGEVILCDVDLSSGNCDLNTYKRKPQSACVTRHGPDRPVMVEFHPAEGG